MNVKKILALLLAAMMVLGMTSAMAANLPADGNGTAGAVVTDGTDNTLTLKKAVVVANSDSKGAKIYYPGMEFNYEIKGVDPNGATVTSTAKADSTKTLTVEIQQGPDNAVSLDGDTTAANKGKVSIPAGFREMNTNGQEGIGGSMTLTVTPDNFGKPGVFRYEIEDKTTADYLASKGIVRGANVQANSKYLLDIYVSWTDSDSDGLVDDGELKVGGFALIKENTTTNEETSVTQGTAKESGFDEVTYNDTTTTDEFDLNPTTPAAAADNDFYYTYNVTLSKVVTGAMGDTQHKFPFDLAVTNSNPAADTLTYTVNGYESTTAALANKENSNKTYMKNDETTTIIGLSPYAKVAYTETNDTTSVYTVTAKATNTDIVLSSDDTNVTAGVSITPASGKTAATPANNEIATWAANAQATLKDYAAVTYTNNLEEISPTGVVLRFAPYMAMFAAGCVLFLILATKRSKKEEE